MAIHEIITLPNKHLRQDSKKITKITASVLDLIKDMEESTLAWEDSRPHEIGVALAAVQIDKLQRIIVIRNDFDEKDDRTFYSLINPKVIKAWGDIVEDHEGCLSVKDVYGMVPRHNKVKIRAETVNGEKVEIKAEGFLARVLQHEIDHLNGKLFIDHIKHKDAFFTLDEHGHLIKLEHKEVLNSDILW